MSTNVNLFGTTTASNKKQQKKSEYSSNKAIASNIMGLQIYNKKNQNKHSSTKTDKAIASNIMRCLFILILFFHEEYKFCKKKQIKYCKQNKTEKEIKEKQKHTIPKKILQIN